MIGLQDVQVPVPCPECDVVITLTVPVALMGGTCGRRVFLKFGRADYVDLWAHIWSHG